MSIQTARLNQSLRFTDLDGRTILLPDQSLFVLDVKEMIGYICGYHIQLRKHEFTLIYLH